MVLANPNRIACTHTYTYTPTNTHSNTPTNTLKHTHSTHNHRRKRKQTRTQMPAIRSLCPSLKRTTCKSALMPCAIHTPPVTSVSPTISLPLIQNWRCEPFFHAVVNEPNKTQVSFRVTANTIRITVMMESSDSSLSAWNTGRDDDALRGLPDRAQACVGSWQMMSRLGFTTLTSREFVHLFVQSR